MEKKNIKMKIGSDVGIVGIYTITKRNQAGEIVDQREIKNMVVSAGLVALASAIGTGGTIQPISHIAVGDGNTPVTASDTDLDNLIIKKPKSMQSIAGASVYVSMTLDYSEANGPIKEVGVFVDETTLFSRISEENGQLPMTKHSNETVTIDYQVNFVSI